LDLLIKGDYGNLSDEQKEIIRKIYETNDNLIHLVGDLLNVSYLQEGKFDYHFELKSPLDLIYKIYQEYRPMADRNNLDFEFDFPKGGLPPISYDEKKLDIAIRNVIDNSLKYTLRGGRVSIKARCDKISNSLVVAVKDNGVGIPREEQKHIGTKFYRARNVTKLQTEGSGLGLFLAKEIVLKHNGIFSFESSEGKGTEIILYFPLTPEKMPAV
jgi:signal transduction histidine kinase